MEKDKDEAYADHISATAEQVKADIAEENWVKSAHAGRAANEREHSTSVRTALRENWKAVCWSLIVSMSIIMEGYDTQLIFSFFAFPAFQKQFGEPFGDGYQVAGRWQSALSGGLSAGAIVGAMVNGYAIRKFGYKPTFIAAMCCMCGLIFIPFCGKSIELQTVGQVLCGYASPQPCHALPLTGPAFRGVCSPL